MRKFGTKRFAFWCAGILSFALLAPGVTLAAADTPLQVSAGRTTAAFGARGTLVSLRDSDTGREYLKTGPAPLFRLVLVDAKRQVTTVTADKAQNVDATRAPDGEVVLKYRGLMDGQLAVTCRIRPADDGSIRWRIAVENHTELALQSLEYPVLPCPTHLGDSGTDDNIVIPANDGNVLTQPEANMEGSLRFRYPAGLSMQFFDYYDDAGGLYVATYDASGSIKVLGAKHVQDAFELTPEHDIPERPGADYTLAYDVVTAAVAGGWQTAAVRYRDWAVQQPWCGKTVAERTDIPAWLKAGPFFCLTQIPRHGPENDGPGLDAAALIRHTREWSQALGTPMVVVPVGWEKWGPWVGPDYLPAYGGNDTFAQFCADLRKQGDRVYVFLSGLHWILQKTHRVPKILDTREEFAKSARQFACLSPDGTVFLRGGPDGNLGSYAQMCVATPGADLVLTDPTMQLVQLGVTGVQADQIVGGGQPPCYSPDHGHPPGYGSWQSAGLAELFAKIRRTAKAKDPDFIWAMEEPGEYFIPALDTYLSRNYYEGRWPRMGRGIRGVPLFTFVYHEFVTAYGSDTAPPPRNLAPRTLFGEAQNFVTGVFPQMAFWEGRPTLYPADADPKALAFLRQLVQLFRGVGQPYLVEGRMMPAATLPDSTVIIAGEKQTNKNWWNGIDLPDLVHSLWRGPSGHHAYALANIAGREHVVTLPLSSDLAGVKFSRVVLHPGAGDPVPVRVTPTGDATIRLPAYSAAIVEIE